MLGFTMINYTLEYFKHIQGTAWYDAQSSVNKWVLQTLKDENETLNTAIKTIFVRCVLWLQVESQC